MLLRIAAAVEAGSLAVLLANLFTVHLDAVTSLLGPVHGGLYLAVLACAFLAPIRLPGRLLAIVPVVGGLLAVAYARRRPLVESRADRSERLRRYLDS
jgi:uncharacterized protein DUF3817